MIATGDESSLNKAKAARGQIPSWHGDWEIALSARLGAPGANCVYRSRSWTLR